MWIERNGNAEDNRIKNVDRKMGDAEDNRIKILFEICVMMGIMGIMG